MGNPRIWLMLGLGLGLAGCEGSRPSATPAPPAVPPASSLDARPPIDGTTVVSEAATDAPVEEAWVEDPSVVACDDACTVYAGCWELVNDGEAFHGGGYCARTCVDMAPVDRDAYVGQIKKLARLRGKAWRTACRKLVGE